MTKLLKMLNRAFYLTLPIPARIFLPFSNFSLVVFARPVLRSTRSCLSSSPLRSVVVAGLASSHSAVSWPLLPASAGPPSEAFDRHRAFEDLESAAVHICTRVVESRCELQKWEKKNVQLSIRCNATVCSRGALDERN